MLQIKNSIWTVEVFSYWSQTTDLFLFSVYSNIMYHFIFKYSRIINNLVRFEIQSAIGKYTFNCDSHGSGIILMKMHFILSIF